MFTGIIHNLATVVTATDHPRGRRLVLTVPPSTPATPHVLGESIAVNGCCLTVAAINPDHTLTFDVIRESLEKTNRGALRSGDQVHLERSLRVGDPIDGHFVQGHVDATGQLLDQTSTPEEFRLRIQAPDALAKYLIPKGSISLDGVSLTLANVNKNQFEVALIPTTLQLTTLAKKQVGYSFNLEFDSMAKTIISYLERIHPAVDHSR